MVSDWPSGRGMTRVYGIRTPRSIVVATVARFPLDGDRCGHIAPTGEECSPWEHGRV